MSELNEATKELLVQGWTRDQTPPGMSKWNDFDGGWTYTFQTRAAQVYETPCGLLVKGSWWAGGSMYFAGRAWTMENNCPTISCPYGQKLFCDLRHELLRPEHMESGTLGMIFTCDCHRTDRPYDYEHSRDKVQDEEEAEAERRWKEFCAAHHGRVCKAHAHYNRNTREWSFRYVPYHGCRIQSRGCQYCSVLSKVLSGKKTNVYYDLKVTQPVKGYGLFPDEERITITKGIKALEKQLPEEVCQSIAKLSREEIQWYVDMSHHWDSYFSGTKYEVMNIRAERRDVRDLDQDLADIANGIEVVHKSDQEAEQTAHKREKRAAAESKRRMALKKKIEASGFDALSSADKQRVRKKFTRAEVCQMEHDAEERQTPEQITFFEEEKT